MNDSEEEQKIFFIACLNCGEEMGRDQDKCHFQKTGHKEFRPIFHY